MSERKVGVIALVPDNWHGIWMLRHHIVGRLAQRFETIWIEPASGWRDYWLRSSQDRSVIQRTPPSEFNLHVYDPGRWLPDVYRPAVLGKWLKAKRVKRAYTQLRRRGCEQIVLYLWRPQFDWALDVVDADLSVYHIDDEYRFSKEDQPNDPREIRLAKRVDQVIIHSRKLLEKKGHLNAHTVHIPNGVEYSAFAAPLDEPADMRSVPRPRMGYVGVVKNQLDIGLLKTLAERNPQWSFVLVGPKGYLGEKTQLLKQLERLPNTYLTGNRQLAELPAYMQAMDVCMMCYEVCDYTNFIYPLKLNEYLATGRPVVSAAIDSVNGLEPLVRIANDLDEWEKALAYALTDEAKSLASVEARQAQAKAYDWEHLATRVGDQFLQRLSEKGK
jgi:glycosyltransferase involved in cell wall biosynthesis